MYTLYYAPGAASLVVHWMLIELDAPYTLAKVDTGAGEQKSPTYLALNPNGVVPTLLIDGRPHYEAAALLMYLADTDPQRRFAPSADDARRIDYLQWMFNLANMVQPLLRQWWYPQEPAGEANAEAVLMQTEARLASQWQRIDAHLAQQGPYLLGAQSSAADFYLTMLMRWSRRTARQAIEWPHLRALASTLTARPSFATLYQREGLSEWP